MKCLSLSHLCSECSKVVLLRIQEGNVIVEKETFARAAFEPNRWATGQLGTDGIMLPLSTIA